MPCCALVACLIGQLLLAVAAVKRRFGLASPDDGRNPAVEWRLGDPAPVAVPTTGWTFRGLAVAAALEAILVLGAIWGLTAHLHHDESAHADHHVSVKEVRP